MTLKMRTRTVCFLCVGSFIFGCTITLNLLILADKPLATSAPVSAAVTKHLFLYVLIMSSPNNFLQRQAIRETWTSLLGGDQNIEYYFVIGTKNLDSELLISIMEEKNIKNDIILLPDLQDNYNNLTEKLVESFKVINLTNFEYVLKCDDDTYIHSKNLIKELKNLNHEPSLYWGFFRGDAKVKTRGQWKESEWNICDNYLPYALGGGYVLSKDLVTFIVNNNLKLRKFKSEDVSVGAWLATIETFRKHDVRFDTEYRSKGCNNTYLILHKQSVEGIKELHNNLITTGKLCKIETELMASFEYNWNVLPSKCCVRKKL